MLTRYHTTDTGRRKKLADVYTQREHGILRSALAHEVISVLRRLSRAGYQAYIVGGAVRDLLLGISPKDYDVATDAHPRSVRRLFRRSRIIGKRFQLVHVYVSGRTLEVSTFRASREATVEGVGHISRDSNNIFGTIAQDVRRRDLTMNALYYDPGSEQIIDYVGGFEDIKNARLRLLIPADDSFQEDAVRMIRALRYAATTGFKLPARIARGVRRHASSIADCPISRLTEELFKILGSGAAKVFFDSARDLGLLGYLLPILEERCEKNNAVNELFRASMEKLDSLRGTEDKSRMIAALCESFVEIDSGIDMDPDLYSREIFRQCKTLVKPLTPPNADVYEATRIMLRRHGFRFSARRRRKPQRYD